MDQYSKFAIMLGVHESLLRFAVEALKGNTAFTGVELAEYIENRLKEKHDEINGITREGNTEVESTHTESTVRN